MNLLAISLWMVFAPCGWTLFVEQPAGKDSSEANTFDPRNDVQFILYTNSGPDNGESIQLHNEVSLTSSNFDRWNPTRITIHGWVANADADVNRLTRNAYLSVGDFNVITVDWSRIANDDYELVRNRVPNVGIVVAEFIKFLRVDLGDITLIGHSLGAHIAGIAGKQFNNGMIQNIVGLDPACPLFSYDAIESRLHYTDAAYVEIISPDAGYLGFSRPIGHATFYPNWGKNQPGCYGDHGCSHNRSINPVAESIQYPGSLIGTQCSGYSAIVLEWCPSEDSEGPNQALGGEPLNTEAEGVYYLPTNEDEPYGMPQYE